MKFENDFYRFEIEKKELSDEQKELKKARAKKRRPYIIVSLILVASIVAVSVFSYAGKKNADTALQKTEAVAEDKSAMNNGTGEDGTAITVENEEEEDSMLIDGEYVEASVLATSLQEKYADESLYNYDYAEAIEDVGREEAITFQLGYDVDDLGVDYWTDIFAMYQDPELTYPMGVKYAFDDQTGILTMEPSDTQVPCQISLLGLDVGTVMKYPHNQYKLFGKGAGTSWGNIGTAYLASYRDKETGELLERPEVSIVTFQAELEDTPMLSYSITEDGRIQFVWNEVEGATEYFVCTVNKREKEGYKEDLMVEAMVADTTWTTPYPEFKASFVNTEFRMFEISEDDWKDEESYEENLAEYGEAGVPVFKDFVGGAIDKGICVIAVNENGTSMISNICEYSDLVSKLPYSYATNTKKENAFAGYARNYETVETLPSYDYITMCDGYTATKIIDYDTENAYMEEKRFMIMDEETGELLGGETINCLCIPYRVEGTCFMDVVTVAGAEEAGYVKADFEKDIAFLKDREAKLARKSGDVAFESSLQFAERTNITVEEIRKVDSPIFANSAMSEYIATNMLAGTEIIDLSDFPESRDVNLVSDAFLEAYYQNPLILRIIGYRVSKNGNKVRVVYENSLEERATKQETVKQKVEEIVAEIITDDMTEQDKVLAINQYLCDTIVYDEAALQNAEENNFATVDEIFGDSFSAYGALVNGKCVCAGYAAAFRLLAQEAGLESIVVTGFLDGTLAHAWNKVKIDEEWYVVDTTNNDNEFIFNALLNLPDSVSDGVLVEDTDYMIDVKISNYTGVSEENEYYHITENYFPTQEVAAILAKELTEKGTATLRTDYEINDNEFYAITDSIFEIMGDDIELYGYYWLGVIYLTMEA